jgi:hypothetical protein
MPPKPLAVTQKQVTAILKGAAKAGVKLEIKAVNGTVYFNVTDDGEQRHSREPDFSPTPRKKPNFDL